ncbi:GNAT family N-acetyltransferase [Leptobacterium sp. I13]|uniref:GNAT family N-acetyltransferase n=1 Tax=Leptobacterium meishanense TaxID=3128904 RepID=UPI0030ED386D
MITLIKTDSKNQDFTHLVKHLNADLAIRDGDEHAFYDQFNKIDSIKHVIIAYEHDKPVGCGAFKKYDTRIVEIKRMYVPPKNRGKGVASKILTKLEHWAIELGYKKCILETGKRQPEAIALYKKLGYKIIPNYPPYTHAENSFCFEKHLIS